MVDTHNDGPSAEDKLLASLLKLDQALHLINSLRAGVPRTFRELTSTTDPVRLKADLEDNTTAVKGDLNALTGLVGDLHQIVQDAEATKHGLVNRDGYPLAEGILQNDISEPVSAVGLHSAYTWEKKAACHGSFASARAKEELRKFPPVVRRLVDSNQGHRLGLEVTTAASRLGKKREGESVRDIEEARGWAQSYEPRMETVEEVMGRALVGLTIKIDGVLQAHLAFRAVDGGGLTLLVAERVVVCAPDEQMNVWSEPTHIVFQRVTHLANAALLHFRVRQPNSVTAVFLSWLHSYHNLFTAKCTACGRHLSFDSEESKMLPPTYRDFTSSHLPYHPRCAPLQ
eukprot:comp12928_c0_seq1/m.8137 comp12928_c0_seq1/g.8137  ORF comp12928_c0_seq1/g.8137 comp12928_c0_seq1/m.8137 type:complete len:343 (-) comp12928_c0_seq1:29-1057(-)